MLEDKSIAVVYILTPNKQHCEIVIAALNANKHVLCEKPMAKSYMEAQQMLKAYKAAHKRNFRSDSLDDG
jgi:predicted dehydrogenase